jgi:macrolide transport system ATP-binding/permease protein
MAVLSLALGIGANTAIYSFMDAITMRALPVQHPEQLAVIHWQSKDFSRRSSKHERHAPQRCPPWRNSPNYPYAAFDLFRGGSDVFSNLFAYAWGGRANTVVRARLKSWMPNWCPAASSAAWACILPPAA